MWGALSDERAGLSFARVTVSSSKSVSFWLPTDSADIASARTQKRTPPPTVPVLLLAQFFCGHWLGFRGKCLQSHSLATDDFSGSTFLMSQHVIGLYNDTLSIAITKYYTDNLISILRKITTCLSQDGRKLDRDSEGKFREYKYWTSNR
jgi:hypothetical protein